MAEQSNDELLQLCKDLLTEQGINPASTIEFDMNGEIHTLSLQQIAEHYLQASDAAQMVFMSALQKAAQADSMGIQKFFEGMGKLLLMASFSEVFGGAE